MNLRYLAPVAGACTLLLVGAVSIEAGSSPEKAEVQRATEALLKAKKLAAHREALKVYEMQGVNLTPGGRQRAKPTSEDYRALAQSSQPSELILDTIGAADLGSPGLAGAKSSSGGIVLDELCVNFNGNINPVGDIDVFEASLSAGDLIQVAVTSEGSGAHQDLYLRVFGPYNYNDPGSCGSPSTNLAESDDGLSLNGTTLDPCSFVRIPQTGRYFIEVDDILDISGGVDQSYSGALCVILLKESEPNPATSPNPVMLHDFTTSVSGLTDFIGATSLSITSGAAGSNSDGKVCSSTSNGSAGIELGGPGCPTTLRTATIGGNLDQPEDVDCFLYTLGANEIVRATVVGGQCSNTLGPKVDPELIALGPAKNVIAFNDDTDGIDPSLMFTAQTAGHYTICVRDHFASDSPNYSYKLTTSVSSITETSGDNGACGNASPVCRAKSDVCIASLTLRNNRTQKIVTFPRDSTWGANTTFTIDSDKGTFHTSCSQCLKPGMKSGQIEIVFVDDPSGRIAEKCLGN